MSTAPRRITRKEIRQPDRFMTLLRHGLGFFTTHRTPVIASAVACAVIVAALLGWDLYSRRQNRLAAAEYARAVDFYHGRKYKEALEALKRLEIYRSSFYSRLGLLYTANTQVALQDNSKAADSLRQLIAKEPKELVVRQTAYVSLGYLQEQGGQCQEAASSFAEAEKIAGPLKADATLGKARCSALTGKLKDALASYRAYVSDNPSSDRINEISVRIQELEAKIGEAPGAVNTK
jgi:predicted negative regulator of RcsB-dependent stress response